MSQAWQYQLRVDLADEWAEHARQEPEHPDIQPLMDILQRHSAELVCQYDAFANYVREAESQGVEDYPLYAWTKETIEDPAK